MITDARPIRRNPWTWVPTLYVAEGLPYALVVTVSVIMYKNLGVSNTNVALYTSWLYSPWVIKPLWSPVVDILRTRRWWIWVMQLIAGTVLAGVALTIPVATFFQWTLMFFFLLAFSSATHDIAADGFYMLALSEREQSYFVGVRNTFYRIAMVCAQGGLVVLAGTIQHRTGNVAFAWSVAFGVMAGLFIAFGLYHRFVLPRPVGDRAGSAESLARFFNEFFATFGAFFRKPKIVVILLFLLLYRFGEAQLVKMVTPFLLDIREVGGLGLTTEQVGIVYGTVGIVALLLGGLLGGIVVSRQGLRFWLWPMVLAIHLPDLMFIYLAYAQPDNMAVISLCVAIEQFGYGFGFTAYMLYMLYIARGPHQTAYYAICTGFMALGMMLPGMWSGWLQEAIGYQHFFMWVIMATVPGFLVVLFVPLDPEFGKRN